MYIHTFLQTCFSHARSSRAHQLQYAPHILSSPCISWSRVHVSVVCFLYPFSWSIAVIFNAFFLLGYIHTVADEFSPALSILPCIQNAPDCISTHIHLKKFPGAHAPDPPRKLFAFGHSGLDRTLIFQCAFRLSSWSTTKQRLTRYVYDLLRQEKPWARASESHNSRKISRKKAEMGKRNGATTCRTKSDSGRTRESNKTSAQHSSGTGWRVRVHQII